MKKILIISSNIVGKYMTGPGIRYFEIARALSSRLKVRLAAPTIPDDQKVEAKGLEIIYYSGKKLASLDDQIRWADIILLMFQTVRNLQYLAKLPKTEIIFDLYDPVVVENLAKEEFEPISFQHRSHQVAVATVAGALRLGDYFICANERQRDYYLGWLSALGRLNPAQYQADATARQLIGVVPFGLPKEQPQATKKVVKGVVSGINIDDFLVIWGGGIWNWFDPLSLIKAMADLRSKFPKIKLLFLAKQTREKDVPQMAVVDRTVELAQKYDLIGKNVFFLEQWVPYVERVNYFLEADLGVSLHFDNLETRFAHRTRILDYFYFGLPIISTEGDVMSEVVRQNQLGLVVPPKDGEAIKNALINLYQNKKLYQACRQNEAKLAPSLTWPKLVKPIVDFTKRDQKMEKKPLPKTFLANFYWSTWRFLQANKEKK